MKNVLVTGGAGFIGSNLVNALLERGYEVSVWDNLSSGKIENVNAYAKFKTVDVVSPSLIEWVLRTETKFDVIFHLAAESSSRSSFGKPRITHQSNVTGTLNMLLLAKEQNSHFVYTSCPHFDTNPYSVTKKMGEDYCEMFNKIWGTSYSICRLFNSYGPKDNGSVIFTFEELVKKGLPLTIDGDGEQRRDFCHVNDVVEGLILAGLKKSNMIFEFGCGKNYSINEVAKMFKSDITHCRPRNEKKEIIPDLTYSRDILGWVAKQDLGDYVHQFLASVG